MLEDGAQGIAKSRRMNDRAQFKANSNHFDYHATSLVTWSQLVYKASMKMLVDEHIHDRAA